MFLSYAGGSKADCPEFAPPSASTSTEAEKKLKREKTAILAHLAAQEEQMKTLLAELEAARSKQTVPEATEAELQAVQEHGQEAADALAFSEELTRRRLIDSLLVAAGWDVGADGTSTDAVGQEVEVDHQPTTTGKGKADYVLWGDNGKPLGVIEAKKTAVDAEAGRTQAKCYADGLEKTYGQRPVIFYTNGYDIWIWNDAQDEPPRKLYGFYSKDSLEYLHFQQANRESLTKTQPDPRHRRPDVPDRGDQAGRRAVRRQAPQGSDRPGDRHRQDPCRRLALRAPAACRWAKRILFLCDRRELRKQAHNVFKEFLPGEPRTYVTSATSKDRDKRIYLATYPAMMECFETLRRGLLRPDHRRRVAPQHLQPLPRPVRLLRLPPGRADRHAGRVHRPQHLQALRLRGP